MNPTETLRRFDACPEAIAWVSSQEGTPYDLWRRCPRGDWLLWLADRVGVDRKLLVTAACACAREALAHVPDGELRPLRAIEAAEGWVRGEVMLTEVRRAAAYADAPAAAHAAYAAAYAAYAAYAAAHAAHAAHAAARAAYAAARAARAADVRAAARKASLLASARHVRRIIPWRAVRDALESM